MSDNFEDFIHQSDIASNFYQFAHKIKAYQYQRPFMATLKYLDTNSHALDWGCGNGHFSSFLLYNKQKTTAFGFGEAAAHPVLTENKLFNFIAADTNEPVKLPFENETFDIVCSMGVLEHVHESGGDQIASLKEIHRILKPQGVFLCFHFPYSGSIVEIMHNAIMPYKKHKAYVHTRRFSREDVVRLTDESRFALREWGRYNILPRNCTQRLPEALANNPHFVAAFNATDNFLSRLLPFFCTQSYFIAQKIG